MPCWPTFRQVPVLKRTKYTWYTKIFIFRKENKNSWNDAYTLLSRIISILLCHRKNYIPILYILFVPHGEVITRMNTTSNVNGGNNDILVIFPKMKTTWPVVSSMYLVWQCGFFFSYWHCLFAMMSIVIEFYIASRCRLPRNWSSLPAVT